MDDNLVALPAAIATSIAVYAHGVLGHRWLTAQLRSVDMRPTEVSVRLFGPRDVSAQVFGLTWHVVTAVFFVSATALYLSAFGAIESLDLLRFIALLHASFLVVGVSYARGRLRQLVKAPIPMTFFACMATAAAFAWIASDSL
jgi:hypothetical protein